LADTFIKQEEKSMTDNLDELRSIDGFPKGKDEDLLALSNPPYSLLIPIRI